MTRACLFFVWSTAALAGAYADNATKPNILFLLVDDLGW